MTLLTFLLCREICGIVKKDDNNNNNKNHKDVGGFTAIKCVPACVDPLKLYNCCFPAD